MTRRFDTTLYPERRRTQAKSGSPLLAARHGRRAGATTKGVGARRALGVWGLRSEAVAPWRAPHRGSAPGTPRSSLPRQAGEQVLEDFPKRSDGEVSHPLVHLGGEAFSSEPLMEALL